MRPFGIMIFIEALAIFFLRQYKSSLNDYKYYNNIYLKRANYVTALKLLKEKDIKQDDRSKFLDALLNNKGFPFSSESSSDIDLPFQKLLLEIVKKIPSR